MRRGVPERARLQLRPAGRLLHAARTRRDLSDRRQRRQRHRAHDEGGAVMRRVVFALVALFAMSAAAQQQPQCGKPNIDFGSLTAEQAVNATSVRITADSRCTSTDVVANTGDAVSVTIDGVSKTGKVTDTAVLSTGVRFIDIAFDKSDASLDPDIRGFLFPQSADVP